MVYSVLSKPRAVCLTERSSESDRVAARSLWASTPTSRESQPGRECDSDSENFKDSMLSRLACTPSITCCQCGVHSEFGLRVWSRRRRVARVLRGSRHGFAWHDTRVVCMGLRGRSPPAGGVCVHSIKDIESHLASLPTWSESASAKRGWVSGMAVPTSDVPDVPDIPTDCQCQCQCQ